MPPDSPLLAAGLRHAKALAVLPPDADFAFIGVKDGDGVRVGIVARVGEHWTLEADVGIQTTTKRVDGKVVVIGTW